MMPFGWHDGWGAVWMIVWWVAIVGIVVLLIRGFSSSSQNRPDQTHDWRSVLDERFARGEISEEEYRERRQVLEKTSR